MLLATCCPACRRPGPAPCAACVAALVPAPRVPRPPGLDGCRALVAYEGVGRRLVVGLKYGNQRAAVGWLGLGLAGLVDADAVDVVTWAPTSTRRRRARGFDQARLLARSAARCAGVPCRSLLVRAPGPAQTGATRVERRRGPAFAARRSLDGASVLVVDDVVTTGATLAAAGEALRRAGAVRVVGLAVAHPP